MIPRRTFLYVPANQPNKVLKAIESDADAVILDLEDAVAYSEKTEARESVMTILNKVEASTRIFVRINSRDTSFFIDDIRALCRIKHIGVVIPKVESAKDIHETEKIIGEENKEKHHRFLPIIESAKGVWNVESIAKASQRIVALSFGAVDYALDVQVILSKMGEELIYPRSKLVLASKVAGIEPPIDTVYTNVHSDQGLEEETRRVKNLGFQGKFIIHPRQIDIVHRTFTPAQEEVVRAQEIVDAFNENEHLGRAAFTFEGEMVDYPVLKNAQQILKRYESFSKQN